MRVVNTMINISLYEIYKEPFSAVLWV